MSTPQDLQLFEAAFSEQGGSCRGTCNCGKLYYDTQPGWTWEVGELEELRRNKDAVALDYSVTYLAFEGKHYVQDCSCWHERARQVQRLIIGHGHQIAQLLNETKAQAVADAQSLPAVKTKVTGYGEVIQNVRKAVAMLDPEFSFSQLEDLATSLHPGCNSRSIRSTVAKMLRLGEISKGKPNHGRTAGTYIRTAAIPTHQCPGCGTIGAHQPGCIKIGT